MAKKGAPIAKGKTTGKPGKVKLSGGGASYTGKTGITQEVPTKKPGRGRDSSPLKGRASKRGG